MRKLHIMDMQQAVAAAYADLANFRPIRDTPAPRVVAYTTDETPRDYFSFPIFSPVYTQPRVATETAVGPNYQQCPVQGSSTDDSDCMVELKWSQETDVTPTVTYLHPTNSPTTSTSGGATAHDLLELPHMDMDDPSTAPVDLPDPWKPVLLITGTEPGWVCRRNATLQRMLDSATPLFRSKEEVGHEMCETCIEHFDNCHASLEHASLHSDV